MLVKGATGGIKIYSGLPFVSCICLPFNCKKNRDDQFPFFYQEDTLSLHLTDFSWFEEEKNRWHGKRANHWINPCFFLICLMKHKWNIKNVFTFLNTSEHRAGTVVWKSSSRNLRYNLSWRVKIMMSRGRMERRRQWPLYSPCPPEIFRFQPQKG